MSYKEGTFKSGTAVSEFLVPEFTQALKLSAKKALFLGFS